MTKPAKVYRSDRIISFLGYHCLPLYALLVIVATAWTLETPALLWAIGVPLGWVAVEEGYRAVRNYRVRRRNRVPATRDLPESDTPATRDDLPVDQRVAGDR